VARFRTETVVVNASPLVKWQSAACEVAAESHSKESALLAWRAIAFIHTCLDSPSVLASVCSTELR